MYLYLNTLCTFVVIFLELANSGPLPNYEIIEETDPYYWSIDESDMLSNFNHDETADHNTTADTMTSSANGYTPRPPVMCAQRVLDKIKIHKYDRFEMKNDMKPVYRKTPVPLRKLTSYSDNATESPSISKPRHMHTEVHCKSKLLSCKTHEGDGLTTDSHNTTTDCLAPAKEDVNTISTSLDKQTDNSSQQPEYCNIDMEDALSVFEVYTI